MRLIQALSIHSNSPTNTGEYPMITAENLLTVGKWVLIAVFSMPSIGFFLDLKTMKKKERPSFNTYAWGFVVGVLMAQLPYSIWDWTKQQSLHAKSIEFAKTTSPALSKELISNANRVYNMVQIGMIYNIIAVLLVATIIIVIIRHPKTNIRHQDAINFVYITYSSALLVLMFWMLMFT